MDTIKSSTRTEARVMTRVGLRTRLTVRRSTGRISRTAESRPVAPPEAQAELPIADGAPS